ncbi:hypothetical protein F5X96DRAFT_112949 [Biscogniauxia mediterranea]|nr:hypothetical protein F5X96DRAFT_112949 [Biscogniauxia mediterranea]
MIGSVRIYLRLYDYLPTHLTRNAAVSLHTHTHTHIYIYVYTYLLYLGIYPKLNNYLPMHFAFFFSLTLLLLLLLLSNTGAPSIFWKRYIRQLNKFPSIPSSPKDCIYVLYTRYLFYLGKLLYV